MEKVEFEPHKTDWEQVIIEWKHIQNPPHMPIAEILEWIGTYDSGGSRYQMRGYRATEGFEFRFENPQDALYFKLKWL